MKWDDIKINHYAKIMQLNEDSFEDQIKAIGIVNGMTLEEVKKLPLDELNKLILEFKELGLKDIPNKIVKKWDGYKINHNMKDITAGQMIDYDTLREQGDELQNLHKFMAILSNPKDSEEFEERARHFNENMPIGVAYGTHVFFCELHKRYEESIKVSLKGKENQKPLENIGGGWQFFTYFQTVIQSLRKRWYK